MNPQDVLDKFKELGLSASYHFADDSGKEWRIAYREQGEAIKLYLENPELQEEMMKISKGFLWSLATELKSMERKRNMRNESVNYNDMFRVFDNGGKTVDRYMVFLADDPELGGMGFSDNANDGACGFSHWEDFDPEGENEISFDQLPRNIQPVVIDLFAINEDFEQTDEDILSEIITCVLHDEVQTAKDLMEGLIADKMFRRVNQLNELKLGAVKFVGNDVVVNGKRVGTIENDLEDFDRGIVFRADETGEEADFDKVEDLIKHIFDVFRIKESVEEYVVEATQQQKGVVKALRQLARKLDIPSPRFRSLNGKAGFVEMSSNDGEIPNKLREHVVTKVFRTVPMNFSDVDYGNVTKHSIGLTVGQWKQLLGHYGIEVPEPMMEGYRVLPPIDRDRYQEREGLEGPFRARNGKVVYYDPVEGKYYDPDSDFYISFEEWEEMDRDPTLRRRGT